MTLFEFAGGYNLYKMFYSRCMYGFGEQRAVISIKSLAK